MDSPHTVDEIDRTLLSALIEHPDATNLALSESTGLARNTIRARIARYAHENILRSFERRINPTFLGFPLTAFLITTVTQRRLADVAKTLGEIPEVLQVFGLSGVTDLLVQVVARDANDLYKIAGQVLAIDGVKRTNTGLVMGELVPYRTAQLVAAQARGGTE
ncbi:MAG TPA: Lrp/AsnC family transcriptional regulator [Galbitalea sp.]|jgi:DNA-binding Lrp family transcriptional regulator